MIWPRQARTPADPPAQAVNGTLWAMRGRSGPVPDGWLGLRVTPDACTAWVSAGQPVPKPRWGVDASVVWWVRADPWQVCFAPRPDLAPEAGLTLTLQLDAAASHDHRDLLAQRLAAEPGDVTDGHWAARLRQQQAIVSLPPCATPLLLARRAAELGAVLSAGWMVRVTALHRCDLSAPVLPESAGYAANDNPPVAPVASSGPAVQAPSASAAAPSWAALLAEDRVACTQLGHGLSRLAFDVERRWANGGWSAEPDVAAQQRRLSQRLGLMAAKTGAWPALEARPGASRTLDAAQRSLVAMEALRALEVLALAQRALQALPPLGVAPHAAQLQPLEVATDVLETHLQARQLPWWE